MLQSIGRGLGYLIWWSGINISQLGEWKSNVTLDIGTIIILIYYTPLNKWVWTNFYLFEIFMLHLKLWILYWDKLQHCLNNIWTNAVKFITIKSEQFHWCAVCLISSLCRKQIEDYSKPFVNKCSYSKSVDQMTSPQQGRNLRDI